MKRIFLPVIILVAAIGFIFSPGVDAQTNEDAVVHAVLFYSPTCPHCHDVINELLVPMVEQYGNRLQILGINVNEDQGQYLYQLTLEHYQVPPTRTGVPTLVVNDLVLVGSGEIPDQFPQIVEEGLAANGIAWPGIPGLTEAMSAQFEEEEAQQPNEDNTPAQEETQTTDVAAESSKTEPGGAETAEPEIEEMAAESEQAEAAAPDSSMVTISENSVPEVEAGAPPFDPVGITIAGLVLGGMLFALYFAARTILTNANRLLHLEQGTLAYAKGWAIPVLSIVGLGVAAYLAYVEISQVEAVCGPVGHCNAVQSSPYAEIFGIPVAVLGILNYLAIFALWLGYRFSNGPVAGRLLLGLLLITFAGTIFSIYLTVLEIFVIQAVCMWCISSAIITTAMMLIVAMSVQMEPRRQQVAAA